MPALGATALLATLAFGQEPQEQKPATATEIYASMATQEALSIQQEKMQCYLKQAELAVEARELRKKVKELGDKVTKAGIYGVEE